MRLFKISRASNKVLRMKSITWRLLWIFDGKNLASVSHTTSLAIAFDDIVSSLDCKNDDTGGITPPHSLLAIISDISPKFEKLNTGIGSQPLRKMGYIGVGLGKSGHGIYIMIIHGRRHLEQVMDMMVFHRLTSVTQH